MIAFAIQTALIMTIFTTSAQRVRPGFEDEFYDYGESWEEEGSWEHEDSDHHHHHHDHERESKKLTPADKIIFYVTFSNLSQLQH